MIPSCILLPEMKHSNDKLLSTEDSNFSPSHSRSGKKSGLSGSASGVLSEQTLMFKLEQVFCEAGLDKKFKSVKDIVASDENSADFIIEILGDPDFFNEARTTSIYEFAKVRARHSVLTFLIGLLFMPFGDFRNEITKKVLVINDFHDLMRLWMITALYHDWAYSIIPRISGNLIRNMRK